MQVFAGHTGFESNIGDVREYSLGDPRVICRILSDYLYSNKLGSIVRELSANAVDAHRMSGKEDVPFDVTLPSDSKEGRGLFTGVQNSFSIRDYGPGLSEDDIYSLYTSYGASNKRSDQSQIGGFGIGSKSPFAYTKTFEVTSWHGGRKCQYVCFLDSSNAPCVKKVSEEESGEPSGIQVKFAVPKDADRSHLRSECEFQYAWFGMKPNGNYRAHHPRIIYENDWGFCIDKSSLSSIAYMMPGGSGYSCRQECRALVNNVVYGLHEIIDSSSGCSSEYSEVPYIGCWTLLKVSGADVDVSASRESLAATKRTKAAVREAYEKFAAQAARDIYEGMHRDAAESVFEAFLKWRRNGSAMLSPQFLDRHWRGLDLHSEYWKFSGANQNSAADLVPMNGKFLWGLLAEGTRGYELNRSSSSPSGFSSLWKMTKQKASDDGKSKTVSAALKNVVLLPNAYGDADWKLDLRGAGDGKPVFALAFAEKKATVAFITAAARALASKLHLDSDGFIHVYAVSDEKTRKAIAEAYGNPDKSRIFILNDAPAEETERVRQEHPDRRGRIEARIAADLNRKCTMDFFSILRQCGEKHWLTVDEIESRIKSGCIPLVLFDRNVSSKIPDTFRGLAGFCGGICDWKNAEWILMNEPSYAKYLALGGKPLEAEDAVSYALSLTGMHGIKPDEFLAWAWLSTMESSLHFKTYSEGCAFSSVTAMRPEHPVSRAYRIWSKVGSAAGRMFNVTRTTASLVCLPSGGIHTPEGARLLSERMSQELQKDAILDWIRKNPILNLLEHRYSYRSESDKTADVVKKYIVWD